jgi:DNA-directed RNA polymerase sigma subunit (sigma70/sigma32)
LTALSQDAEGASGAPGRVFGLMKAVKFEYRRGYTLGLRHVVRTIRIPVHTMEAISRVVRTSGLIFNEIGREPMVKWCL